mgnify:CR=1 FL=1
MLRKIYSNPPKGDGANRYSPGECCGIQRKTIIGNPVKRAISTSYVERQNLTMRMNMRRFTRLTNAFSKKIENLAHAVALSTSCSTTTAAYPSDPARDSSHAGWAC